MTLEIDPTRKAWFCKDLMAQLLLCANDLSLIGERLRM